MAERAFQRAIGLSRAGKHTRAARELEKAVARDPAFGHAYANLAVQYLLLERFGEAEEAARRSLELDPSSSFLHSNLAAVLLKRGDFHEAGRSARRALELSGANDRARYLLGLAFARDPTTHNEALRQLELAARTFPPAQTALDALRNSTQARPAR
jgi:tetratricopeptide (TPR) repeat protein